MASVTTATSEWIQFFKDAGIPAGLAVNYAVSFVDNRIQKNMLMDLSKDIMIDLGITVIGDVIAILKHAKQVYRQDMCKMATEAISAGQTSVQAELRRTANTPAARMIANALSHDSPPATPTRRSDSRLSVTVSNSQANKNKAVLSQPADEGSSLPAAKRRRVTAEMEGLKRTSVFERLGAESMADTTTNNNKPTGVFSRLDGGDENGVLRSGSTAAYMDEDDEDSNEEGSVLQYAGVLKTIPSKKKASKRAAPTALRRLGGKFKQPPSDIPTSSSASSLKSHPTAKISVLQRLGKPLSTNESVSATPADTQDNRVTSTRSRASGKSSMASCKVSSSTGAGGAAAGVGEPGGAKMDIKAVSVFKRLGSKKP
uniref:Chromosome 19 open reading frame 47 n=1 Tax=Nothobranchius rachovii TaxID=451742 RepID=A0A1A8NCR3_9TELE